MSYLSDYWEWERGDVIRRIGELEAALVEACRHQGLPEDAEPDRIAQHFRGNRETAEGFRQIAAELDTESTAAQANWTRAKVAEAELERIRAERDAAGRELVRLIPRLDRAEKALRLIADGGYGDASMKARAALKGIEES